jgi:glyoxylase-like metal-dependent hydrolase (beta-lactamase superfamily II)
MPTAWFMPGSVGGDGSGVDVEVTAGSSDTRIYRLGGGHVNWWAIEEGGRLTLVDSGLPGQWNQVEPALASIGRSLPDVEAVLLTHAHPDHAGLAEKLRKGGAQVYAHPGDEKMASGRPPLPTLAQTLGVLGWLRRPGFIRSAAFFIREGLLWPERVAELHTFDDGEIVDVPGRPRVLHLPGHTPGSCALLVAHGDAIFTGDALVTTDVYSGRKGPRLSARASNDDSAAALASLRRLKDLEVSHVLPGHGPPWSGGVAEAARLAAEAGAA